MPETTEIVEYSPAIDTAIAQLRDRGMESVAQAVIDLAQAVVVSYQLMSRLRLPRWVPFLAIGGTSEASAPVYVLEDGTVVVDGSIILPGSVDASTVITAGSITTPLLAAGAVVASKIAAFEITAGKLNLLDVIVDGLTLTDNSPAAGRIAWSACTVYYGGASYSISSGNTAATTNFFVTWTVGASTFAGADTFTPSKTIYLIATNTGGTGDVAWNKLGRSGVQRTNLAFALLEGFQLQIPGYVQFTPTATLTDTTVLSVTADGGIIGFRFEIVTPDITTNNNVKLRINIDGAGWTEVTLYDATSFHGDGIGLSDIKIGNGQVALDYLHVPLGFSFKTSANIVLRHQRTTGFTSPTFNAWASYVLKT